MQSPFTRFCSRHYVKIVQGKYNHKYRNPTEYFVFIQYYITDLVMFEIILFNHIAVLQLQSGNHF